jgi:hypothetical protein
VETSVPQGFAEIDQSSTGEVPTLSSGDGADGCAGGAATCAGGLLAKYLVEYKSCESIRYRIGWAGYLGRMFGE